METPIAGHCAAGLEPVREAFATNFAERGEVGGAVCVMVGGEVVVDLWGGWCDEDHTRPWAADTLVDVYSVGKAITATMVLQLVDQGLIDVDTPLADVWPEYAAAGKGATTVAHALTHQAGVPGIREPLTNDDLWDWDQMAAALAATEPWWEPGAGLGYHVNTFGHLCGEIVHRVTGQQPDARLGELVAPRGIELWCGLPETLDARCADTIWANGASIGPMSYEGLQGDALMSVLAHFNPPAYSSAGVINTRPWRAAQVPSTNIHGTAPAVAAFYGALLGPDPLLSADLLETATRPWVAGQCPILGDEVTFGLGFTPTTPRRPLGPNPRSFGHFGTGGSLGFADPDAGLAFGYVMNHVVPRWQSTRNRSLIDALYECL